MSDLSTMIEEQLRRRAFNSRPSTASLQASANSQQQQRLELAFSLSVVGGVRPLAHYATLSDPVTFFGHALRMQVMRQLDLRAATQQQAATIQLSPEVANQLPVAVNGGNSPREDTLADNASSHSGSGGGNPRPYSIGRQMNQVTYFMIVKICDLLVVLF